MATACTWRGVRQPREKGHAELGTVAFASLTPPCCGPHLPLAAHELRQPRLSRGLTSTAQATRRFWHGRLLDGPCDVHVRRWLEFTLAAPEALPNQGKGARVA